MRVFTFCLLPLVVACSSSSSEATPAAPTVDAGPPTVSTEACAARCATKAAACGAPAAQAAPVCAQICNTPITETQASCLEATSCGDLISAASNGATIGTLCPGAEQAAGSDTETGTAPVPAQVTVATIVAADYLARHTDAGGLRSSLVNVAGPPLFLPAPPLGVVPKLGSRTDVKVMSPPRNGCEAIINVTVSTQQLAVSTSGVDILPDTKCSAFLDAIATEGATFEVDNVSWKGSQDTSKVTIVLRKLSAN